MVMRDWLMVFRPSQIQFNLFKTFQGWSKKTSEEERKKWKKVGKEKDRFIDFELCILYSEKGNQCQLKEKGRKVLVLWLTLFFSILLDRV